MRFRPSGRIIHETIDGEVIIIHLDTGVYYSLRDVGATIWSLFDQDMDVDQVVAAVEQHYEGSSSVVRAAVDELCRELATEGLFESIESDAGVSIATATADYSLPRIPFATPRLEKHTDMQDLILLDPVHEVDSRGWPHIAERDRDQTY